MFNFHYETFLYSSSNYTLHGHSLEHVTSAKYFGCTITSDLKWGTHINNICNKANSTIGFLKRNLNIANKSAARYVTNRYHNTSSVSDMLDQLEWPSLESRTNSRLTTYIGR